MSPLFNAGNFILKSGMVSRWKIDCDALTHDDWHALALIALERVGWWRGWHFDVVISCGGAADRFAAALRVYQEGDGHCGKGYALVVDDVMTTGSTMEETAKKSGRRRCKGVVVFARGGPVPAWILPLFYCAEAGAIR